MTIQRHKRDTHIEVDSVMDASDRKAMQLGYAVLRYRKEWVTPLLSEIERAREECKNSYGKRTPLSDVSGNTGERDN